MFSMFGGIAISVFGGGAIGYSIGRKIYLQAIVGTTRKRKESEAAEKEETP